MPKLSIFTESNIEKPKPQDQLRERLRARGLTDDKITEVLEGLDFN
jgi:SOS response regulatory protein OraA/RecX